MSPIILVPAGSHIVPACDEALDAMAERGFVVRRVRGYSAVDAARNQMASDAVREGYEDIFWVDSDIVFKPDDMELLRSHGQPFVCGVYPKKGPKSFAAAWLPDCKAMRFGRQGGLAEILYCGFGFVYTHRIVYETIQAKLELPVCNARWKKPLVPFFGPLVVEDAEGLWSLSEDFAFCERARQCGISVYADTRIRLYHVGTYGYSWEDVSGERQRFDNYTLNIERPGPKPAE